MRPMSSPSEFKKSNPPKISQEQKARASKKQASKITAPVKTPSLHKPQEPAPKPQGTKEPFSAPSVMMAGLKTREDVFISVWLDKVLIFKGILKKGRSENWTAKNSIEFSIGNAGAVELVYNGKLISPLGRPGQSLKQVLINKDGLSIK